jgi:hypothetical protein
MAKKFDPAPADKHADVPDIDELANKSHDELDKALKDSFPASDPASSTQPAKSKPDAGDDNK